MRAHPQRDLFLVKDVQTDDQTVEEAGQDEAPARAHVPQLAGQRIGRSEGRRPKVVDQRDALRPKPRLGLEELLQPRDQIVVGGLLAQVGVVEKLVEGGEGRVHVGQPEHQQLFEGDLAVGDALRFSGQVFAGVPSVTEDRERRELLHEVNQGVVKPIRLQFRHERGHGIGHDVRVHGPAVDLDGVVEDLVDQPHRVQLGGVDDAIGVALSVGQIVHALGKRAGGREVGNDDVAAGLEKRPVEPVVETGRFRDVELECQGFAPNLSAEPAAPERWAAGQSARVYQAAEPADRACCRSCR